MKTDSLKFLGILPFSLSLVALTATAALGAEDAGVTNAAEVASEFNQAVATTTQTPPNCLGQAASSSNSRLLPDAPTPNIAKKDQVGLGSLLHFSASIGVSENPQSPGAIVPKGTVGVTIGKVDLAQALAKMGVSLPSGSYIDGKWNASPMSFSTADTAGKGAIEGIQQSEAGDSWEAADIKSIDDRVSAIKKDALTQEVSTSAAIVAKDGTVYECKAGKAPQVAVPAVDPNGTSNKPELLTGGSSTAMRVGSSYSTIQVQCVEAKPLGKDSKLQFSFLAYRNTIPYVDENSYFGNQFGMAKAAYEKIQLGPPNSVRGGALGNKTWSNGNNVGGDATVGETEGKLTYSANASATTGRNTAFAGFSGSYYPNFNTAKPEKQTGEYAGDSLRVISHLSVFGAGEKDIGSPNCSTSANEDCTTDFEIKKVGAQWSLTGKTDTHQTRWIVGAAYQNTKSLDDSLNKKAQGDGILFYGKYSYSGLPFMKKNRKPAAEHPSAQAQQ